MDWGKPPFQLASLPPAAEHQRRYTYDGEHPWRDDESSARPIGFPNSSLLMPCATMVSSMKLESPFIHDMPMTGMDTPHQQQPQQLDQPPMGDFQVFPSSGPSNDYVSNGGYGPRSSQSAQMMPTLSSYFSGNHGPPPMHPPGDYFGEGMIEDLESNRLDLQRTDGASCCRAVLHGFPTSEQDAASAFPPPPQLTAAATASILDERSDDFGEMPTDVSGLLSTHQLNQMMVTPPSAVALARPSALSPVSLLPGRARLSPEACFGLTTISPSQQQQQQYLNAAVDGLAVAADPKFSPDRRKLCCIEGCKSQARAFNRCKRHGGSKRCAHPGCTKSVQSRGLCIRHGGGSRCQEPGCARAAQSHGRCKMHGGGRPCMVQGCDKKAHLKRLCRKHGGGAKCSVLDCDKWAQRQGKCMTHSKEAQRALSTGSSVASTDLEASAPASAMAAAGQGDGDGDSSPADGSFEHVHV